MPTMTSIQNNAEKVRRSTALWIDVERSKIFLISKRFQAVLCADFELDSGLERQYIGNMFASAWRSFSNT